MLFVALNFLNTVVKIHCVKFVSLCLSGVCIVNILKRPVICPYILEAAGDETPSEATPAEETPSEETPAVGTPKEEAPVEETSTEGTPVEETPTEETPEEEAPSKETPAVETPAEETPSVETPVEETPSIETPAEETPSEETPAEETQSTETPVVEPTFGEEQPQGGQFNVFTFSENNITRKKHLPNRNLCNLWSYLIFHDLISLTIQNLQIQQQPPKRKSRQKQQLKRLVYVLRYLKYELKIVS